MTDHDVNVAERIRIDQFLASTFLSSKLEGAGKVIAETVFGMGPAFEDRCRRKGLSHLAETVRILSRIIDGRDPEVLERCGAYLRGLHRHRIDRTSLDLVRSTATHVAPLLAVASHGVMGVAILDGPAAGESLQIRKDTTIPDVSVMDVTLPLVPGVVWSSHGSITIDGRLPEMAAMAYAGRPLRDLLAHPILDALRLEITHVEQTTEKTQFETDHIPATVALSDLTLDEMAPIEPDRKGKIR